MRHEKLEELIEFVLMHTEDIRAEIVEAKLDGRGHTGGGGTGHSKVGDPTAIRALKNLTELPVVHVQYGPVLYGKRESMAIRRPEKWLRVAEQTAKYYLGNPRMAEFYKRRYVDGEDWRKTCSDLNIRKSLYYAMKDDVLRFVMISAAGSGLIGPHSKF